MTDTSLAKSGISTPNAELILAQCGTNESIILVNVILPYEEIKRMEASYVEAQMNGGHLFLGKTNADHLEQEFVAYIPKDVLKHCALQIRPVADPETPTT